MKTFRIHLFASLLVLLYSSCRREQHTSWDVDLLGPLAETSLGLENLIADSLLYSNTDEPLSLRFERTLSLFPADSVFRIPDTTFYQTYSFPLAVNLPPGFTLYNINDQIRFDYKNTRITEVILQEGKSIFTLENYLPDKLFFDYSIQQAFLNGNSLHFSGIEVPQGAFAKPHVYNHVSDFSNYWLNLKGDNGNQFNRLRVRLNTTLNPNGQAIPVPGGQMLVAYRNSFVGLKPYYVKGYMGNPVFESNDSINFEFLKKFEGHFEPAEINLSFAIENGIGADFELLVHELSGINSRNNTQLALQHEIIGKRQFIKRARNTATADAPFTSTLANYTLNTQNSNLGALIGMLPDKFAYKARISVNPLGNISSGNDFLYAGSNIKINLKGDIPLRLSANSLQFIDTITTQGYDIKALEQIQSGKFTLLADNGFPFQMQVELTLLDENRQLLRRFFTQDTIEAAPVSNNLVVTTTKRSVIEIPYHELWPEQLQKTRFLVLKCKLSSKPENTVLAIYPAYKLRLQLIGNGIFKIKLN
ncbi:MAG: hypothetical protein IT240_06960 [Bacteroidia bacterium]|nr:hypothetical protein [Bacteroidia bacterium]MCC6768765.1 hypothetical protein [Bacteroidia bacterium]